jgi:hypothetical protein
VSYSYLSAATFITSSNLHFRKEYSYRNLYDRYPKSTHANYANALADTMLVFGGHDGATGSIFDGSTGGLLGDMWMLRFANFSTAGSRHDQTRYECNVFQLLPCYCCASVGPHCSDLLSPLMPPPFILVL